MLQDEQHPGWKDREIDNNIAEQLDYSKGACIIVVSQMLSILENLKAWSTRLAKAIEKDDKVRTNALFYPNRTDMKRRNIRLALKSGDLLSKQNCA